MAAARFTRIDAELAEARELWAWYADPQHRQQVARAFAWWRAPHMLPLMLIGYESLWWVRAGLYKLGDELAGQHPVARPRTSQPPVDDKALTRDWTQHGMLSRRRELLRLAIGTDRLVLYGSPGTAPRIEAVRESPSTR